MANPPPNPKSPERADPVPPRPLKLLVSAGPTHEPVDAVRYLGNRSSGRLGLELASAGAQRGWDVTLLLGPVAIQPPSQVVRVERFVTAADLESLLADHFPACDVLIMAAAVADFRPAVQSLAPHDKLSRSRGPFSLSLEPTPDLLAQCAARRRPDQTLIGFALEPEARLMESAREKLARKNVDAIVANPLRTMDAPDIDATVFRRDGSMVRTPGRLGKHQFGPWLLDLIEQMRQG